MNRFATRIFIVIHGAAKFNYQQAGQKSPCSFDARFAKVPRASTAARASSPASLTFSPPSSDHPLSQASPSRFATTGSPPEGHRHGGSQAAGLRRRRPARLLSRPGQLLRSGVGWPLLCLVLLSLTGCGSLLYRFNSQPPQYYVPNPLTLPPAEDMFVWLQVVDVVDDYFRIRSEQPVQNRGDMILEGRLETSYRIGASLSEPWRKDGTAGFERLQSTLQSIRRRALVFVRPAGAGYEVEVVVQKELEHTDRSLDATEGTAITSRDNTVSRREEERKHGPVTLGWIPLGRDESLEQVILQDILGRVTQPDGKRPLQHR